MNTKTICAESIMPAHYDKRAEHQGVRLSVSMDNQGFKVFLDFCNLSKKAVEIYCCLLKYKLENDLRRMYQTEPPCNVDVNSSLFLTGEKFSITAIRNGSTARKYFELIKHHLQSTINLVAFTQESIDWSQAGQWARFWFINEQNQAIFSSHRPEFNPVKRVFELPDEGLVMNADSYGFMGHCEFSVVERDADELLYMPEQLKRLMSAKVA